MPFFIVRRFARISIWATRDDEYSCKRSGTAIEKCQHLVERGLPKVAIKDRRSDNGRQREKYKLSRNDDFGVKTFQRSIEISNLKDTCEDEHLQWAVSVKSTPRLIALTDMMG